MQHGNISDQQSIISSRLTMSEILDDIWKDEESFMPKFDPSALLKSQDFDKKLDEVIALLPLYWFMGKN
ncbi:unnamed protein product [Rotaria socialis]|uniref:Uncharacterized protein n=2 Tax=Rotaria socialis TaxID=392032 RepID=A0A817KVB8_9BILA|nr:unnamed protein product [Rotaria socialis]CAF3305956.1 unnamed protein product [Rotaria socialis]CAF3359585.1 unnamed protein product [Rotaria socialis]CAF3396765.1 unnamed protein product [Rotaria socialis]CAF4475803.1 unnamed protein product [Rotaria socialis]